MITETNSNTIEVLKNKLGFGGSVNPRTTKPYAVKVNGRVLETKSGAIRTFASRLAAQKAGETQAKTDAATQAENEAEINGTMTESAPSVERFQLSALPSRTLYLF